MLQLHRCGTEKEGSVGTRVLCMSLPRGELGSGSAKQGFIEQCSNRFCERRAALEGFGEKQAKALKCKLKGIKMSGCGTVVGNLGCDRHLVYALQGWRAVRGALPGHVEASVRFWLWIPSYGAAETGEIQSRCCAFF